MFFVDEDINIKKNYIKHFIIYLSLIHILYYLGFKIFNDKTFSPYSRKIDKIKIGDGISIKIGIISDFQLNINSNNTYEKYYGNNVYKALKIFKNKKIDLLLIVGDITTDGESINYLYFKKYFIQYIIIFNNQL